MRFTPVDPPRRFTVGVGGRIELRDCGRLQLDPDEQVTILLPSGAEFDVARKAWGFYATPSMNGRLSGFGLRAALVINPAGRLYLTLVEAGAEGAFDEYLAAEDQHVVAWLDSDEAVRATIDRLEP